MPRRPPHFKVFTSIQNHRHTLGVFDNDALLAMYVRAGILAIERYADRTGDSFLLSSRDLQRVAGCEGVANALRKLARLEASSPIMVEVIKVDREGAGRRPTEGHPEASDRPPRGQRVAGYRLTFPNLAKKQFGRDGNGAETGPPSTSTSTSTSKEEEKESAAPAASRSDPPPTGNRKKNRASQVAFPEPFPHDLRAELQRWAGKSGFTEAQVDVAIQTVADWAVGNDKRKASWVRTIQGAMRKGWALNRKQDGPAPKEEAKRREYLEFDSPEWNKAHGYEQ